VESLAPSFFIFSEGFRKSGNIRWIRRVISFTVAFAALLILSPVFLILSLLIPSDSRGPIFYLQERVGLNGKPFLLMKFRSMIENAEENTGPRWATQGDPRITRVGRFIRKFRIDEIPQLLNVLKGDLDLVGPRPERPVFVKQLEELFPYYALRHTVRPGVTGWAQVMFTYCGTMEESREKLQYDLFYVKNMSIKLDLLILFRTIKILLLGRGAR
jgi:exopolysaccharide biosynthesis polyprenyl glycosylphosphotransferase